MATLFHTALSAAALSAMAFADNLVGVRGGTISLWTADHIGPAPNQPGRFLRRSAAGLLGPARRPRAVTALGPAQRADVRRCPPQRLTDHRAAAPRRSAWSSHAWPGSADAAPAAPALRVITEEHAA